jgi:hypothetical protein
MHTGVARAFGPASPARSLDDQCSLPSAYARHTCNSRQQEQDSQRLRGSEMSTRTEHRFSGRPGTAATRCRTSCTLVRAALAMHEGCRCQIDRAVAAIRPQLPCRRSEARSAMGCLALARRGDDATRSALPSLAQTWSPSRLSCASIIRQPELCCLYSSAPAAASGEMSHRASRVQTFVLCAASSWCAVRCAVAPRRTKEARRRVACGSGG